MVARHRIVAPDSRAWPWRRRAARCPRPPRCSRVLEQVAHLRREAARGAAQLRGLRDDVVGRAGLEHADRDHRRLQRIDIARDDRLDLIDDLRADQHAYRSMACGRAACPPRPSISMVRRSAAAISGPGRKRKLPDRQAGIIVHAVDFLDAEALHQAVLHHGLAAGAALLGRLEDHDRGAGEIARLGEVARRAQQHRGVAVMAAGVHLARHGRLVGQVVRLLDRQRIHVGAQPDDRAPSPAALLPRMTPTTPVRPMPVTTSSQPKLLQLFGDRGRGAMHVVEAAPGWACRSRRQAVMSPCRSAMRLTIGMGRIPHWRARATVAACAGCLMPGPLEHRSVPRLEQAQSRVSKSPHVYRNDSSQRSPCCSWSRQR